VRYAGDRGDRVQCYSDPKSPMLTALADWLPKEARSFSSVRIYDRGLR